MRTLVRKVDRMVLVAIQSVDIGIQARLARQPQHENSRNIPCSREYPEFNVTMETLAVL